MTFDLHRLGWNNFQQLCHTIVREIWDQTVEAYLDQNDGGRDGAFVGEWKTDGDADLGRFVIQCKHTKKAGQNLRKSDVTEEVQKAERLVQRGLCDFYVLMTNAGVTGKVQQQLERLFVSAGVKRFQCYGATWINQILAENKRLRMLVPRVYGLGDLTQILDERSYAQARAVLDSMRSDLAVVVRTGAYDRAARALERHGFVLLLGEPACGKTTVGAQLTLSAIDIWGCSAIKLDDAVDFAAAWNPEEPTQLFWLDDAFGTTQLDITMARNWARVVPRVHAAIRGGARFVLTSRDYIFRAARPHLKTGSFPLLDEAQVVVDVRDLTPHEREQILYNHLKHGSQSRAFLRRILPYLESAADHPGFSPELARRLANPLFTKRLGTSIDIELAKFFSHPSEFLADVIEGLSDDEKGALGLVYLGRNFLPSPVTLRSGHQELLDRLGSDLGGATRALTALNGSLIRYTKKENRPGWVFAHPTMSEAYAKVVGTPELLHLLAVGFPLDVLLSKTTCGEIGPEGAIIFPPTVYELVVERFSEPLPAGIDRWRDRHRRLHYLTYRCDREFLERYLAKHRELLNQVSKPGQMLYAVPEPGLAHRLRQFGLLPEANRRRFAEVVIEYFVRGEDPGALTDHWTRQLLTEGEIEKLRQRVVEELLPRIDEVFEEWASNYDPRSNAPRDHFDPLVEVFEALSRELADSEDAKTACGTISEKVGEFEEEHPPDEDEQDGQDERIAGGEDNSVGAPRLRAVGQQETRRRSIFDDLLE